MAGVDAGGGESRSHKKGKKKRKKRVGIRIDMTPLVDVCMLLLTFFMVTTVFNKPQTMELNMPPSDTPVEVPASKLLTIRILPNLNIYWSSGLEPTALKKVEFKELRKFLIDQRRSTSDLITLVQIDREAKYNDMVDVVDELNLAEITKFSFAPMKESDKRLIARVAG